MTDANRTGHILHELDKDDIFFLSWEWPDFYYKIFMKPHREYFDRMVLMLFFCRNGMNPQTAKRYIKISDSGFDRSASRHLDSLAKNFAIINFNVRCMYTDKNC